MLLKYQTIIARLLIFSLFLSSVLVQPLQSPEVAQAATAASPTGREPKFYWSGERQAMWNKMRSENNNWWQLLKYYADRSTTCNRRIGDIGQWATIAYQITGEKQYADAAWTMITTRAKQPSYQCESSGPVTSFLDPNFVPEDGRNFTREAFIEFAWMYDWLYPALSPAQRQEFSNTLYRWSDWVLGKQQVNGIDWNTRLNDSDEATGHYFGVAMTALTATDNPRSQTILNETHYDTSQNLTVPVGGLSATAADRSSMRNAIKWLATMAEGGEWLESSEYNVGTLRLLNMGSEATRTATGQDHFPELTALAKQTIKSMAHQITPDLKDSYQWGDVQEPRHIRPEHWLDTLSVLTHIVKNDSTIAPYAQGFMNELISQHNLGFKNAQPNTYEPSPTFFVFYDPYAPTANWRTLQKDHYASGQGMLYYNDMTANGTLFGAHAPGLPLVDHSVWYLGNFQLYRKGEWALTHPIGYQTTVGKYVNSMLFSGLSGTYEGKKAIAQESASGEFAYLAGTNGGQYYGQPYYDPPETFLHEWTRSLFYLPGNGGDDAIVVYDRTNAEDPKSLARIDRYQASAKLELNEATEQKEWIIHTPVVPTQSGNTMKWQTSKGQHVAVSSLLPINITRKVLDEKVLMTDYTPIPSEKNYQVRIIPQTVHQWDTFLNVISASDDATQPTSTLVTSQDGKAEGTLVQRSGTNDAVVLFSSKEGPKIPSTPYGDKTAQLKQNRLHTTNFTVTVSPSTATTNLYIADLDATKSWSIIDNGKTIPLSVSDQGMGKAAITGTGSHAITVSMDGTAPVASPSPAPEATPTKADIQLTLGVDKTIAKKNDTLIYTVTYKNVGGTKATNVTISQTVPPGVGLVASSLSATGSCFNATSNTIRWQIGQIEAGQEGSVTFQAIVGQTEKPADSCSQALLLNTNKERV